MGLAAAYHAAKAGHEVTVLEAGSVAGGMAAHFDLDGTSIERFYHFICKADQPTFDLLEELGIGDQLAWRETSMGHFSSGKLHKWGDPFALLSFPDLSFRARIRYGLLAFVSTRRERWDALETQSAREWITRWAGREVYEKMWAPLFKLKFYEYSENISAAWIWTRVKRIGRSRKSLLQEELGYLKGGSETLVNRLLERIEELGGTVQISCPVNEVLVERQEGEIKVTGVSTPDGTIDADAIISTVPTPLVSTLVPSLPEEWKARYDAIENIGVACLVFKLKRSVTEHFWVNIAEPDIPVPGLIEFSNLRPVADGEAIVFVPYYMPVTNEKFSWPDQKLLDEAFSAIRRVNPDLDPTDILASTVSRLKHSQPICEPGFARKIPPVETPIGGLQIADTCFYYPEDRGISESARVGKEMAANLGQRGHHGEN